MRLRNALVILAVIVLAGFSVYRQWGSEKEDEGIMVTAGAPRPGSAAPILELAGLDGEEYKVGGSREKPLFLNFWASWCPPCKEEAPELARLYEKYKDKLDLYAVNLTGNDDFEDAKSFALEHNFTFPVLLDYTMQGAELYRFQVIPTSYLIDKDGRIVDIIHYLEPDELEKKMKKLINE